MKVQSPSRLSAQHWVVTALQELAEHGPDALTIENLCLKLNKTKGSFYAHFNNHDVFLDAVVQYWRQNDTQSLIHNADQETLPHDRLTKLNHLAVRLDDRIDRGMRMLAHRKPKVAEAVRQVDDMRIACLADLHIAAGHYCNSDARDLATIEYAAYIGLRMTGTSRVSNELDRLHKVFTRLISR